MTVTASRLGSSPLTVDWSNLVSVSSGSGTSARLSGLDTHAAAEAWTKFRSRVDAGEIGFYNGPIDNAISQATESQALANEILRRNQFSDCIFLGIGGSSLGPISMLAALQDRCQNGIKFHFVENPDATDWTSTVSKLNPASTLVCVVTKSGTTFETMALLLLSMEWLGKDRIKTNVVAITDPKKGDLRSFATAYGLQTLSIAPSVGGRFSIFTPVGLFAAALAGLSVADFITGAKQVRDYMEKAPVDKNALFILGYELLRHQQKRPIHVCMPYSTRLRFVGNWFVQLWAESLGKDGKGFTPLAAVGANDQHSILQLLRDGPDDKVTLFLGVDKVPSEVKIPRAPATGLASYPAFKILEGHSLHELLGVEYRATSLVLTKQGRPNVTIQLDQLDERALGALYFAFSALTAYTGTLWNVDPFDQPGVEEAKVYIRESLNRSSAEAANLDDENSPVGRLRRDR